MKFVKAKVNDGIGEFSKSLVISINKVYLFPYIIPDDPNKSFYNNRNWDKLNKDYTRWDYYFDFIEKEEYLKEMNMNESMLSTLIDLLESNNYDNQLIALTIYKKHINYEEETTIINSNE